MKNSSNKDLTLVILGKNQKVNEDKNVEVIYSTGENINDDIKKAKGKYIAFIKEEDKITKTYLEKVLDATKKEFDCCFINYDIQFNYKRKININKNFNELKNIKPLYGEYIWAFIFKKEKLLKILEIDNPIDFNKKVDEVFKDTYAISDLIYFHNPQGTRRVKKMQYSDIKRNEYYKNIIYMAQGANGSFNGYISWVNNLGRCFGKKYDIVILYDKISPISYESFSKYFKCVERRDNINYICDSLSVTYASYYYPKNIFTLDQNYMFIHGNMSDYPNARKFHHDIYSHYVAVSKVAAEKAKGYFPTKKIEHIINPFKLEKELVKPHLTLTSAFRYCDVKRPDRIEKMARVLDELEIPYTWNVFTDQKTNTNDHGLIYRKGVTNPIPYVQDSDYFVLLSDSEAMPYCVLEALAVNTKVIVTPLGAYKELGIKNEENGFIIPFSYFEDENKDKLKRVVKKIYKEKESKVRYKINKKLWDGYNNVFVK